MELKYLEHAAGGQWVVRGTGWSGGQWVSFEEPVMIHPEALNAFEYTDHQINGQLKADMGQRASQFAGHSVIEWEVHLAFEIQKDDSTTELRPVTSVEFTKEALEAMLINGAIESEQLKQMLSVITEL